MACFALSRTIAHPQFRVCWHSYSRYWAFFCREWPKEVKPPEMMVSGLLKQSSRSGWFLHSAYILEKSTWARCSIQGNSSVLCVIKSVTFSVNCRDIWRGRNTFASMPSSVCLQSAARFFGVNRNSQWPSAQKFCGRWISYAWICDTAVVTWGLVVVISQIWRTRQFDKKASVCWNGEKSLNELFTVVKNLPDGEHQSLTLR